MYPMPTLLDLLGLKTTLKTIDTVPASEALPTPIEPAIYKNMHCLVKRDDTYTAAPGACGGKARTAACMVTPATQGLITAGGRGSRQIGIVAALAKARGLPARVHIPAGEPTPWIQMARDYGAEIIEHRPGYTSVIVARAKEDLRPGWVLVPYSMETQTAVLATATQVPVVTPKRILVSVGSGMTLAGILHGLNGKPVPITAVIIGADPIKRLNTYAPRGWRERVELVKSKHSYHDHVKETINISGENYTLDPVYEAKLAEYIMPDDLVWITGGH